MTLNEGLNRLEGEEFKKPEVDFAQLWDWVLKEKPTVLPKGEEVKTIPTPLPTEKQRETPTRSPVNSTPAPTPHPIS